MFRRKTTLFREQQFAKGIVDTCHDRDALDVRMFVCSWTPLHEAWVREQFSASVASSHPVGRLRCTSPWECLPGSSNLPLD